MFAWRQQERIQRFNPLDDLSLEMLTERLAKLSSDLSDRKAEMYRWMVEQNGVTIGSVSFKPVSWQMGHGEIGYGISEPEHGKGLGTAAVRLLVEKIFAETDIHKLFAYVSAENVASCRILERLGFRREGYLRDHYVIQGRRVDEVFYAILRHEFCHSLLKPSQLSTPFKMSSDEQSQLIEYLVETHKCHTIILYGSFARGDATESSDVDILGIRDHSEPYRIGKPWNGRFLDAWIYDPQNLPEPGRLSHLLGGVVLKEHHNCAAKLLSDIAKADEKPETPKPYWEREQLSNWLHKMHVRAECGDIEGHYRRSWLLTDLLPLWFSFSNRRYYGSKRAFEWLQVHEPGVYRLFKDALAPNASMLEIQHLVAAVRKEAKLHHDITLRPAIPDDAHQLAKVHVDSWRESYAGIIPEDFLKNISYAQREERWHEILNDPKPNWHCLVALNAEGTVIGFVTGGANRTPETGPYEAEIYAIYLRKEFHHTGIGKRLFHESIRQLIESGFSSMMLWALEENPTRAFYSRMGGKAFATKSENIGGKDLKEIGFGWSNLTALKP